MGNRIVADRESLYGGFEQVASYSQQLKQIMKPALDKADPVVREGIEMILHKLARINAGEEGWKVIDNFADIAGYAHLCEKHLQETSGAIKTVVSTEKLP